MIHTYDFTITSERLFKIFESGKGIHVPAARHQNQDLLAIGTPVRWHFGESSGTAVIFDRRDLGGVPCLLIHKVPEPTTTG